MTANYFAQIEKGFDEIGEIGNALGKVIEGLSALEGDSIAMAMTLFLRSWSHFRAFKALMDESLLLEAEIILRGSVEVAICLSNLEKRGKDFLADLNADQSSTLVGQLKMLQNAGITGTEKLEQTWAEEIAAKGKRLDLETLAKHGDVADLYVFHRVLSGTAAHITGLSVVRHTAVTNGNAELEKLLDEAAEGSRRRAITWMITTMAQTYTAFAGLISDQAALVSTGELMLKLQPALSQYATEN